MLSVIDLVAGITRRLPRVRGAGVIANGFRKVAVSLGAADLCRTFEWESTAWKLDLGELTEAAIFFFPQLYNHRELNFLRAVTPRGGCFVDVGANIGFYSVNMARHVGSHGRCLAIEAEPGTAAKLRKTIDNNQLDWVIVSEHAISDHKGTARFEIRVDGNRGSSRIVAAESRSARSQVVEMATEPLLSVLSHCGFAVIDSMKVDLEGHEERVFEAFFADAPSEMWPRHLVVEFLSEDGRQRPLHSLLRYAGYAEKGRTSENLLLSRTRT